MSKFGVEFFYENLVKNFEPDLLNVGGTIIKNRIRLIVEWLNLYDFQFKAAHRKYYSYVQCVVHSIAMYVRSRISMKL